MLAVSGLDALAPPHHRPDARHELPRSKWLDHVVIGAHLETQDLIALFHASRDHDDGDGTRLAVLLEASAYLPAIELGHHAVEQDHLGSGFPGPLERVRAVGHEGDLVAFLGEVVAKERRDILLVL